ncbi:MAG: hypothetical protein PHO03_06560 [Candidatus Omnitrophica bacterium]|nr:hypothetical protein [Candidatus Omnitrophota bacterium]
MPQVSGGPEGLNSILEKTYQACMKQQGGNEEKCSRIAWTAAENEGWHKNKEGEWIKS